MAKKKKHTNYRARAITIGAFALFALIIIGIATFSRSQTKQAAILPAPQTVIVRELPDPALIKAIQNIEDCFLLQTKSAFVTVYGKHPRRALVSSFKEIITDYTENFGHLEKNTLDKYFSKVRYQKNDNIESVFILLNKTNTETYWFDLHKKDGQYLVIAAGFCWQ